MFIKKFGRKVPYIVKSWSFKNVKGKPKPLLKVKKNYIYVPQRPITKASRVFKIALISVIGGILLFNSAKAWMLNRAPAPVNPFQYGNVFETNGNDVQVGEDGNIILDNLSSEEKQLLFNSFNGLILDDAQNMLDGKIGKIDEILSITMIPYDLSDKQCPLNFISILFRDEKDTYALNYLAFHDFVCEKDFTSDFVVNFNNYLIYDCAIDSCQKMDESQKKLLNACPGAIHVGNVYLGRTATGEDRYFIPLYFADGKVQLYSSWTAYIDGNDFDPIERLADELSQNTQEKYFECNNCTRNEDTAKMVEIFNALSQEDENEFEKDYE